MTFRLLTSLAALIAMLFPPPATAQDGTDEVFPMDLNDEYARAASRAERGDLGAAIRGFKEIAALDPYWSDVFYNIGTLSEHRSSWQDCAIYFRRYLILEPDDPDADDVERSILRCEEAIVDGGTLTVTGTDPDLTRVSLDGVALGDGGFGPIRLRPGTYVLTASRDDYFDFTQSVDIVDGSTAEVLVRLEMVPQYGSVDFNLVQEGARIIIDGVEQGVTPLAEPIRLEVGGYAVEILADGFHPWRRNIDILRDLDEVIDVRLLDESVDLSQFGR